MLADDAGADDAVELCRSSIGSEAWRLSVGGMMGRMYTEYFLPLLGAFGFKEFLKHRQDISDGEVTADYCARHNWAIGSPRTVATRLEEVYHQLGGLGGILLFCFDYADNPQAWRHSMELLAREVMPKLAHLKPAEALSAVVLATPSA
jgi:alkanesulfonate monooxygenase SsuD/methylene tetrahydromethanopterin reductase-like flavin-dependent oxidoreductase (luciferase family)